MSNKQILNLIAYITLTIAFLSATQVYIPLEENTGYILLFGWDVMFLVNIALKQFRANDTFKQFEISFNFKFNFLSKVIIYGYTLFLVFTGLTKAEYLSSNIQTFINGLSAISIFYFLGEDSFKISGAAIVTTYLSEVFAKIMTVGVLSGSLEFHDMAFSAGYIVIFIMLAQNKWTIKTLYVDIIAAIVILLAGKRIGIASLFACIIWAIISKLFHKRKEKYYIFATGIVLCVFFNLFVSLTLSPNWIAIAQTLPFNMQGRDYYYAIMRDYAWFGVNFLGLGRNACSYIISHLYKYFSVGNIHSDILRMYCENGLWLFEYWLISYIIIMPQYVYKKISYRSATFVMVCTMYTFMVYLTDNTELYLMNNYFYFLVMILFLYKDQKGSLGIIR